MDALTHEARWYLIQAKPREDERALEHLVRQGFSCYRPVRNVERIRHGRRQAITESLFPGYLFIHLDRLTDNWHPIRSTRGVNRIVGFGTDPTPVPDAIIETVRRRLEVSPPQQPEFLAGERVRIVDGPFADLEAIFLSDDSDRRVTLLLNILQRDQKLSFSASSIRKC